MSAPIQTTGQLESISIQISSEVARALEALADPAAAIDRAIRRELRLPLGGLGTSDTRPVGRPRKHSVEDLADCLGSRNLTTGEFQRRAAETLDFSRTTFYRLLDRGRREFLFRQRLTDGKWIAVPSNPKSHNGVGDLPDPVGELADRTLSTQVP
jgi:hypothetical protein